jgi:hypothetical protein
MRSSIVELAANTGPVSVRNRSPSVFSAVLAARQKSSFRSDHAGLPLSRSERTRSMRTSAAVASATVRTSSPSTTPVTARRLETSAGVPGAVRIVSGQAAA